MCQGRHRVFYCGDCINKGEFTHSNPRKPGYLTEKRIHFENVNRSRQQYACEINQKIHTVSRAKLLSEKIKLIKQNIKYLNNITKEKIEQTKKTKAETEKLKIENSKRILRLPQFGSKVNKINQFTHQHLEALEQNRLKLNQKLRLLSMKRKEYLSELSTYIFPIEYVEVQSQMPRKDTSEGDEDFYETIMAEMEDAMSTSYIHGRWVTTSMTDGATAIQLEGEKQWKIVAPHLPANDSLLYSFVASSEAIASGSMISPLHTILGGLSLTVQFLAQISSCIDVIYPKRISTHDFSVNAPSNEYQFAKKWSKLNLNVAYLCLSQQLDLNLMKPCEALYNLSNFMENIMNHGCLINRPIHLETFHKMSIDIGKDLEKHKPNEATDAESDNDEDYQEEIVDCLEDVPSDMMVLPPALGIQNVPNSPSPPPNTMSVVGSFMSSVIRGFTSPVNSPTSPHK